ncbi:CD109 antigen-like [Paramacrobiotus metropolitanus]|uniref:CD109 antigen-like n=1 Tax=Paramacrobiotus metropolitanus TaxID=2943436 RepID=UPI0024460832|nr:CD109 antigen-like [Paramacrobiotus metropolitanus]
MMHLHFLAILPVFAGLANADLSYFIIGPKTIYSNSTFPISILCRNASSDVKVDVTIRPWDVRASEDDEPHQSTEPALIKSFAIKPNEFSKLEISVPDLSQYATNKKGFALSINGTDSKEHFSLNYARPVSIGAQPATTNKIFAFIQTDQPLYKAKDTVLFRIVTVDRQLLPFRFPLTVRILDPQHNIVKQYSNATDPNVAGYFAGDFLLSAEPLLGSWTIQARTLDSQVLVGTTQFSVDEYVLPRFDVKILSLPSFVTSGDATLNFFVEANYTFGEPVKGKLEVTWTKSYSTNAVNQSTSIMDFNGRSLVTLPLSGAVSPDGDYSANDKLEIKVNFTEALTGQTKAAVGSVSVRSSVPKYKITLLDNAYNTIFTPGKPFHFRIRISDQDGRPPPPNTKQMKLQYLLYDKRLPGAGEMIVVNDSASRNISLESDEDQYLSPLETVFYLNIPASGIVDVDIPTPTNARRIQLRVEYMDDQERWAVLGRESPSISFLDIKPLSEELRRGEMATFGINMTTRTNETIHFMVQSNSNDSFLWINSTSEPGAYIVISVPLLDSVGLVGRLTVFYIRNDGEIVGNVFRFLINLPVAKTEVTVSAEAKSGLAYAQPGEEALFKARTSPSSFVAFLAVDESMLLLKSGNDLSLEEMTEAIKVKPDPLPSDMYSVKDYFERIYTGQFVLTNEKLLRTEFRTIHYDDDEEDEEDRVFLVGAPNFMGLRKATVVDVIADESEEVITDNLQSPAQSRKDFRSSFLFETAVSSSDGVAEIQSKVPDSITTWRITAFSLSNSSGLGLTSVPAKLKVFQPFFAVLNLPFSIVRYENLTAEVLVFNYMSQQQDVRVQLEIRNPDKTTVHLNKNIVAKRNEGVTVAFTIVPQQIGDLILEVTVQSAFAADQMEKMLPVKPEGVKQYYSRPVFIDLRQSLNFDLPVTLPPDPIGKVAGSDRVEIRFVGDILGAAMNNLDKLIRLPFGCGEQNMATTTPNLVVAKYLKQLSQLAEPQKSKLISNIQLGYQRELTYRHTDDSYSAWGNADRIGSTWLTAYVARVFSEAKEFVTSIDDTVAKSALRFLMKQQDQDGSFVEHGKVIDKQHQGGASAGVALTAFTLLSFLEHENSGDASIISAKENAVAFLESRVSTLANDSYTLAITAYALGMAKSTKSAIVLDLLEQRMIKNTSVAYWTTVASLSDQGADDTHSYPTNAKDVEATAYALLAFLANNKFSSSLPIVSWLISKQNAEGGFVSTQDTVVGLTALAEFAKAFINPPSMRIDAEYEQNTQSMSLTPETSVVLQSIELPNKPQTVNIKGQGKGVAIAYLSWTYHIAKPAEDVAFDLNVSTTTSVADMRMRICSRYIREGQSSMAVIEVNALSGYQFDEDEVRRLVQTGHSLRKTELENKETKLNLYFDQLKQSATCFKLTLYRVYKVKDLKDQSIVVYDYYNPKERQTVSFNL